MSEDFVAFKGGTCLARGTRLDVALAARAAGDGAGPVLIFDPEGRQIDLDLSGTPEALAARLAPDAPTDAGPRGRGRPKLGVTAREVTLLPRHWDWLAGQPGGASVALRKLVEAARREAEAPDRLRRAREATYRFASALAGDLPGFEEATRALFAGDAAAFEARITAWPQDLAEHARRLSADAFGPARG
ncbi:MULTISPECIES: DUF2239 family protein [unclassified Caulobacter]|uniref:DUF2239 family protein n=1 Tax=unclassified Caulobacter TaxID=2648921 RepID=UPI000D36D25E|nr:MULTISPECIES: DUF2239 family protein [unclassified Caulobacter]PTS91229.1 DUF2239 domain-containing protein [Caulobacter sp. HMWF009]PTT10239.1 DUF2239 domain-containing protein [Caulobacter sp. HMWF025]